MSAQCKAAPVNSPASDPCSSMTLASGPCTCGSAELDIMLVLSSSHLQTPMAAHVQPQARIHPSQTLSLALTSAEKAWAQSPTGVQTRSTVWHHGRLLGLLQLAWSIFSQGGPTSRAEEASALMPKLQERGACLHWRAVSAPPHLLLDVKFQGAFDVLEHGQYMRPVHRRLQRRSCIRQACCPTSMQASWGSPTSWSCARCPALSVSVEREKKLKTRTLDLRKVTSPVSEM